MVSVAWLSLLIYSIKIAMLCEVFFYCFICICLGKLLLFLPFIIKIPKWTLFIAWSNLEFYMVKIVWPAGLQMPFHLFEYALHKKLTLWIFHSCVWNLLWIYICCLSQINFNTLTWRNFKIKSLELLNV